MPREDAPLRYDRGPLATLYNIWSTDWIQKSLQEGKEAYYMNVFIELTYFSTGRSSFSFLRFIDVSPNEAHETYLMPVLQRRLTALHRESELVQDAPYTLYVLALTEEL